MSVAALEQAPKPLFSGLPLVLRLAWREQRNGLKGFYVFIACVALGVAVIAGVGSLADALRAGFERQGEAMLGGDVVLSRPHKPLDTAERAWLARHGRVSESANMRAMARRLDASEQVLVEVKGVDGSYPLAGEVKLAGGVALQDVLREGNVAAVDPILLARLGLKIGDFDVIELNEAFAAQGLAVMRQLGLPDDAAQVRRIHVTSRFGQYQPRAGE